MEKASPDAPRPVEPRHQNGDASFCLGCGEVGVFDTAVKGAIRFPSMEEHMKLMTSKLILSLHMAFSKLPDGPPRRPLRFPDWMRAP